MNLARANLCRTFNEMLLLRFANFAKFARVQACVQNSAVRAKGASKRQRETIKVFQCKYYKTKQRWRWRWSGGVQRNVKYLRKEEEEEEEEKGCREISRDQKCGKRNGREKAKSRTENEKEEER